MKKTDEIYERLFTPSGCLKFEALRKYNSLELSEREKELADVHLKSCEMCTDALEGLSLVSDQDKLSSLITEINENLNKALVTEKIIHKPKAIKIHNRVFYYAAAASILILFGIFSYFRFYWQKPETELSVLSEQTIDENVQPPPTIYDNDNSKLTIKPEEEPTIVTTVAEKQKSPQPVKKEKLIKDKPKNVEKEPKGSLEKKVEKESLLTETERHESFHEQTEDEILIDSSVDLASVGQPVEYFIRGVVVSGERVIDDELSEYSVNHQAVSQNNSRAMGAKSSKSDKKSKERSLKASGQKDSQEGFSEDIISEISEPEQETTEKNAIFTVIEQMPEFPGGEEAMIKYLSENLIYPDSAKVMGIQGTVYISFIIKESGEISNAKINRGIGGGCDKEALRVIESMPDWLPGLQRGKPVRVLINMPVVFRLN